MHIDVDDGSGGADASHSSSSGGDGSNFMDADFWVDRIPADGRLGLTVSWLQAGLPEARTVLALDGLDRSAGYPRSASARPAPEVWLLGQSDIDE